MKRGIFILILVLTSFLVYNCMYDNEEELYPDIDSGEKCDTLNISLSNSIKPILSNNCYSCHSNSNSGTFGAGINLETYSGLVEMVNRGRLIGAITHSPGFIAMPQGGTKLDDCSISKIRAWINGGALNN
jgi:hypothetical protein